MEIKVNGKVIKLDKQVELYLRIIGVSVSEFTKEYIDTEDNEKYYIGHLDKMSGNTLGITLDGKNYAWFDAEHYDI